VQDAALPGRRRCVFCPAYARASRERVYEENRAVTQLLREPLSLNTNIAGLEEPVPIFCKTDSQGT